MLTNELCRMFKYLACQSEGNILHIQRLVSNRIKDGFLTIEHMKPAEMDALLSIVSETASPDLHVGSVCRNERGQLFTIIGYIQSKWAQYKNNAQSVSRRLEFSPNGDSQKVIGLFYDAELPER
jgi:hypothetical protein